MLHVAKARGSPIQLTVRKEITSEIGAQITHLSHFTVAMGSRRNAEQETERTQLSSKITQVAFEIDLSERVKGEL